MLAGTATLLRARDEPEVKRGGSACAGAKRERETVRAATLQQTRSRCVREAFFFFPLNVSPSLLSFLIVIRHT